MHDRAEWVRRGTGPQVIKGKTYKSLTEFSRLCLTCNQPFSIFVTQKIADGGADTNSFGLKNCELHRRGGNSTKELDQARLKERTMTEELETLYATNKALTVEVAELKQRLSQYELPTALQTMNGTKMPWE